MRRWKRSEQQSCRSPWEVSSGHAVCGLTRSVMPPVTDGTFYRLSPAMQSTLQTLRWSWAAAWTLLQVEFHYLKAENSHPGTAHGSALGSLSTSVSSEFFILLAVHSTVNSCAGHMCRDKTLPAKRPPTYVSLLLPMKWLLRSSASRLPPALPDLYHFHPNTQGHSVEVPLGCQTVFLHHREVVVTLELSPNYLI